MPPYFFQKGLRINSKTYLTVLQDVVKPWMDHVAAAHHYSFQQDGAPAHNAKMTQDWLKANVPEMWEKEIWPPSSPDCNPWTTMCGALSRGILINNHTTQLILSRRRYSGRFCTCTLYIRKYRTHPVHYNNKYVVI